MAERVWKFSRSHDETFVDCPRKGYLQYYYGGTGIVRKGLDLYQSTGSLTHAILEQVMLYAKENQNVPHSSIMNVFCNKAVSEYRNSVKEAGFDGVSGAVELEMDRQSALAEGLARVWTMKRLPDILEQYDVVTAEEEHEIPFAPGIVLMSRIDGILKRKMDGELFAGPEFKTTGWMSEDYVESWRYSTQTLSHSLDVQHIYGKFPSGVMMEFLYKGMKKKNPDGDYVYYSPLVRAYKMVDELGVEQYGFDSSLGKKRDWHAFDTYTMGMEKWVECLPDEVLEGIVFSNIVYRNQKELDVWKLQTAMRQARIRAGVEMLQAEPTEEMADEIMAGVFPARMDKFCYSNQYRKHCPYLGICFGQFDDPMTTGIYEARTPHHSGEFEDGE